MGNRPQPLLVTLQGIIERTFDLDTGIRSLAPFVIGDEGMARIYGSRRVTRVVSSSRPPAQPVGPDARVLLRESRDGLRASLYLPDALVGNLERNNPAASLSDGNVDDFATLVEEVDHFLTVADRHRAGAETTLLELELHANVTKELMLALFVARMRGTRKLSPEDRSWIRHHLFHKVEYMEEDREVQDRYRDAASLAVRYLDHLETLEPAHRPVELRRFHRRTHHQKLEFISRIG